MTTHERHRRAIAKPPQILKTEEIDRQEVAFLATCQEIYQRHGALTATFENFIAELILQASRGNWPTPDDVDEAAANYRGDFDATNKELDKFQGMWRKGGDPAAAKEDSSRNADSSTTDAPEDIERWRGRTPAAPDHPATTKGAPMPTWAFRTPACQYDLTMFGTDSGSVEEINLEREEYIAVKHFLTELRGYDLTVPEDAKDDSWSEDTPPRVLARTANSQEGARR